MGLSSVTGRSESRRVGSPASDSRGRFRLIDRLELEARPARKSNPDAENRALHKLAQCVGDEPHDVLHGLLTLAIKLCGGGPETSSSGVSLLETTPDGKQQFRWVAMAGQLADHVGGTTPRDFSPCGECLDRGQPVLFARPDLRFKYFLETGIEFTECLVIPFAVPNRTEPLGTIWVVSHPPVRHQFDLEDQRVMQSLAAFTAAAYSLSRDREEADRNRRETEERIAVMSRDVRAPLHTIAGCADLISLGVQGPLTDEQADAVDMIKKTGARLSEVVRTALETSLPGAAH